MKKSLIALAVLATAGTAFAQATISGKFGFAYDSGTVGGATSISKSGLGQTDGNVTFAASEDLGGGLKAGASIDIRTRGRGAAGVVDGRDALVYVTGGFGTVTMGAVEAGNGIQPLGSGGAAMQGLDGSAYGASRAAIDAASNVDILKYTSPTFGGGFSVAGAVLDTNMGQYGMGDTETTLDATLLVLGYNAGPVAFVADYTKYGFNNFTGAAPDKRTRISGSYNFGVATIGLGFQTKDLVAVTAGVAAPGSTNNKQTIVGISAPLGSLVLGAAFTRNTQDAANNVNGYELDANYNLSKRTSVLLAVQHVSEDTLANSGGNVRVRLMHKF